MRTHLIYLFVLLFIGCSKKETPQVEITSNVITLNPSGYSPLSANIQLTTSIPVKVSVVVLGKNGSATNVTKDFDVVSTTQQIPILGLYPDFNNTVEVILKDASGSDLLQKNYTIKTNPLPDGLFPAISIITNVTGQASTGMTFVSYFGYKSQPVPQSPFAFDNFGDVRWYLDFSSHATLKNLFYDDGFDRLQNGNLYFGDTNTATIYEVDMWGYVVNTWPLTGYNFHHNVQEKPNGNFLVTASKLGSSTVEDFILEIDRTSKQIITTWDLKQSLQYGRQTLTTDGTDWIHVNAVIPDPSDNTIIISGRTQGLVKLDYSNNVVWIMGCHRGWGTSGNNVDLTQLLLQPLDHNGTSITNPDVLDGSVNASDFEWNWYQHAPILLPNGHVMLFDNGGDNRNFSGYGQYSRAVEFEINATNKTVKQIWEYGKELGSATFSHIVSNV
ncbi:MAG TPA: hypothetical protein DGG95_03890, partial [Cytophagales bacterium]|nr:hypothetical protein [Cytophagales bacterium]